MNYFEENYKCVRGVLNSEGAHYIEKNKFETTPLTFYVSPEEPVINPHKKIGMLNDFLENILRQMPALDNVCSFDYKEEEDWFNVAWGNVYGKVKDNNVIYMGKNDLIQLFFFPSDTMARSVFKQGWNLYGLKGEEIRIYDSSLIYERQERSRANISLVK